MKTIKKKIIILLIEAIVCFAILMSATYAFFLVSMQVSMTSINVTVMTTNELVVKEASDPLSIFGNNFNFTIDEEFEMQAVTTVTAHSFFYEFGEPAEDENDEPYGYIVRDYIFFSYGDLDVYLEDNGDIFLTDEEGEEANVVNTLRLTFLSYSEVDDGLGNITRTYQSELPNIYARNKTETIVEQDLDYEEAVIVPSFTTLGVTGGTPVFQTTAYTDNYIRMIIWLEGNDEDTVAEIATAVFSATITLKGVVKDE